MIEAYDLATIVDGIDQNVRSLERLNAEHADHLQKIREWSKTVRLYHAIGRQADIILEVRAGVVSKLAGVESEIADNLRSLIRLLDEAYRCG